MISNSQSISQSPRPYAAGQHSAFTACEDLIDTFARHGGVSLDHGVEQMVRLHNSQPISVLARWIVQRRIVSFERAGLRWIPLFQFNTLDMTVTSHVQAVLAELVRLLDDEEVAQWFALPSAFLDGQAPVQLHEQCLLLAAARADCFLIRGN